MADLLKALDEKIATLRKELEAHLAARKLLAHEGVKKDGPFPRKGRMSAAGRAAIAKAQKARWAKVNAGKRAK
jgi:hypothetical protein